MKAVLVDRIGLRVVRPVSLRDFAGVWPITTMFATDSENWDEGESEPAVTVSYRPSRTGLLGAYEIGRSSGSIDGDLREFGGEQFVVLNYEGMDELDLVSCGGWIRLSDPDTLKGEFIGALGAFTAIRQRPTKTSKHMPKRRVSGAKRGVRLPVPKRVL